MIELDKAVRVAHEERTGLQRYRRLVVRAIREETQRQPLSRHPLYAPVGISDERRGMPSCRKGELEFDGVEHAAERSDHAATFVRQLLVDTLQHLGRLQSF